MYEDHWPDAVDSLRGHIRRYLSSSTHDQHLEEAKNYFPTCCQPSPSQAPRSQDEGTVDDQLHVCGARMLCLLMDAFHYQSYWDAAMSDSHSPQSRSFHRTENSLRRVKADDNRMQASRT